MAHGQGTLKQKPNGKWFARYWGPDGRQHAKTFDRKGDAQAWLDDAKVDRRRGSWIDPGQASTRFDHWAAEFMRGQHGLEPSSRARDESFLRNHVLPAFGDRRLGQITPLDVRAWVNDLVDRPLAPRTVRECHRIFSAIMRSAVAAKLIGEAPVGRGVVKLPKATRKRERFLTDVEVERLVQAISPQYRVLIYTAAYTGCRPQELFGLLRTNVDVKGRQIHVRTVSQRDGGRMRLKEYPKSAAGFRTINIPGRLAETLAFHLASIPDGELGLVFPNKEGDFVSESNYRQRHWTPAVEAAGLTPLTPHDLRHTHVAWLIEQGVHEHKIVRRMGWEDATMLHKVYGHLFPNAEDDLVEDLDRRWTSASNE